MKFFDGTDFSNTPVSFRRPISRYVAATVGESAVVSIVTPFYNTGAVFNETVKCVLGQSLQQWEWIIVNDGSNLPDSLRILDQYRFSDPRIKIIDHEANSGLSSARNTGFRHASTSLVFLLDSDDLIEVTTLEKLAWSLESRPGSAFVSSFTVGFGDERYLWNRGFHEGRAFLRDNLVTANCMIRKKTLTAVGGFDESRRQGLEDWDFWLRCANAGYWGHTVTEFLEWYRRRLSHGDRWTEFGEEGISTFRKQATKSYQKLKNRNFSINPTRFSATTAPDQLPFTNILSKGKERILLILPWLVMGGADHFNLSLVRELTERGVELTIATTLPGEDSWCHEFARYTNDIFMLHRFLELKDFPRFLIYLIGSRQPDFVVISNSELGYLLLPYLRSHCPEPTYLDYCHMEEPEWRQGGFPALSIQYRHYLDASLVASMHLKRWMMERGGEENRIHVCRINVDTDQWHPNTELRQSRRKELGIDDGTAVILYAARLCRQKLPLFFAEIIRDLAEKSHQPFVALVVGDGEDGPVLARYVKKHRIQDHLRLLGKLPIERMHGLMAAADIFMLPSQNEGISLAIYEAMASEVAVVAADVGGQKELVVDGTGILLPAGGDAVAKKRYIDVLIRLLDKPSERQNLGKAARERIEREFHLGQMVDNFDQICRRATEDKHLAGEKIDAASVAVKAVQYVRAFGKDRDGLVGVDLPVKTRLYALFTRIFGPLYFWCLDNRFTWVISMKDFVRKRMGVDEH